MKANLETFNEDWIKRIPLMESEDLISSENNSYIILLQNKLNLHILDKKNPDKKILNLNLKSKIFPFLVDEFDPKEIFIDDKTKYMSLLLERGIVILFEIWGINENDLQLCRFPVNFKTGIPKRAIWKMDNFYYLIQNKVFCLKKEILKESSNSKSILINKIQNNKANFQWVKFYEDSRKIFDLSCSHTLHLFYILCEDSVIKVVNELGSVIMKKTLMPSSNLNLTYKCEARRIRGLLRKKRTDKVISGKVNEYDSSLRDFILVFREKGVIDIFKLNDFKNETSPISIFSKLIGYGEENDEYFDGISIDVDSTQNFCYIHLKSINKVILLKIGEHFSKYNFIIHDESNTQKNLKEKNHTVHFFHLVAF